MRKPDAGSTRGLPLRLALFALAAGVAVLAWSAAGTRCPSAPPQPLRDARALLGGLAAGGLLALSIGPAAGLAAGAIASAALRCAPPAGASR